MTNRFKAKPPKHRPDDVTAEDYLELCKNPQCAHLERCGGVPCAPVDEHGEYCVDLDHISPRAKEGWSDLDNLQWLCPGPNRSKYINPDQNYAERCFFDADYHGEFNVESLRPHQLILAYNLVRHDYRKLFARPGKLLKLILLLAWLVGAGKTIGVVAVLMAWNHVRLLEAPAVKRAKRVLWLVHQNTLVRALQIELQGDRANGIESDLVKYGLVATPPRVERVETVEQWGNTSADIVVACPQALWPVTGRKLTDEARKELISSFDVIVIDENQFAVERYMQILSEAPQALKIGVSATPMDASGTLLCDTQNHKYQDRFAILSTFSYADGIEQGIYKELVPLDVGMHKVYHPVEGGKSEVREGLDTRVENNTRNPRDVPRKYAVLAKSVQQAYEEDENTHYKNLVMVRVGSINDAKNILRELTSNQAALPEVSQFGVTGVWAGSPGPSLGDSNHPWMRIKQHNGRCRKVCKRMVITVDIGQFGINNRFCSVIAWVEPNQSLIEIVQRIGRAIRNDGEKGAKVRLLWNAQDVRFEGQLRKAIEYILDMPNKLSGFQTLDTVRGDAFGELSVVVKPELKYEDKLALSELLGTGINSGRVDLDALVGEWKEKRPSAPTEEQENAAREFIDNTQQDNGYRDALFNLPASIQFNGAAYVEKESPPDEYSKEKMCQEVEAGALGAAVDKEVIIERIKEEDIAVCQLVASTIRDRDRRIYAVPRVCFSVENVLRDARDIAKKTGIVSYAAELTAEFNQLLAQHYGPPNDRGDRNKMVAKTVRQAINGCAAQCFRLPDMRKSTYQSFEPQLVDALLHPYAKRAIRGLAVPLIIDWLSKNGYLPGLRTVYEEQIKAVRANMEASNATTA